LDSDLLKQLPDAPQWAVLTGLLGKCLILGGILLFVACIVLWLLQPKRPGLAKAANITFIGGSLTILGAMACLITLFAQNQFEYLVVFSHSDILNPLKYKLASVWAAQQGSFLLWGCGSAIFGLLALRGTGLYRRWYSVTYSVFLGCLCGILAFDSPFQYLKIALLNGVAKVPHTGQGLTPSLQNYWMVIHPPTIFMGFGSLTIMFALSVAAMLTGNVSEWVKIARPWALVTISVLGVGVCMGGMWAYETLGWGGFWAWDPVENMSIVPWLFTVAFVHGIIVQVTKKRWIGSNLILGGIPFLTFVYGTLLTRSGLLDKVSNHSFAEMDKVSLILLVSLLIVVTVAFIALYIARGIKLAKQSAEEQDAPGYDREGMYRVGVLLVSLMAICISMGLSWPWWCALLTGNGRAIEERQYHLVIVWFFVPTLLLMGLAPFVAWRKMGAKDIFNRIVSVLSVTAGLTGFSLVAIQNPKIGVHLPPGATVAMPFHYKMLLMPWMAILMFVCIFTSVANIWRVAEIFKRSKLGIGGFISHLGVAMLMAGLIISRGFEEKESDVVVPGGGPTKILGYSIAFDKLENKSLTDRDGKALFAIEGPDGQHFEADPGLYYYPGDDGAMTAMVWPYIQRHLAHDFYMAMSKPEIYAWQTPLDFQPGQTRIIKSASDEDPNDPGMTVTYKKFVMQGPAGSVGTTFGALLHINDRGREYDVTPTFQIGEDGPKRDMPQVGSSYRIAMLNMEASDHSVNLQLLFSPPLYPIMLFYKPMTILVWIGTGIMALGGLISAFARRFRKSASPRPFGS